MEGNDSTPRPAVPPRDGGGGTNGRRLSRRLRATTRRRGCSTSLSPERLEDRRLLAVSYAPDPANPGKDIVRFVEDLAGASDQLFLNLASGGLLEYRWNGAAASTDLDSSTAGVQSRPIGLISKVEVVLGAGDDLLSVDNTGGAVAPSPGGIAYDAGLGTDRIAAIGNEHFTLGNTSLVGSGGVVIALTGVERGSLTGGNSPNRLDATLFGGPVSLSGLSGDDSLTGGAGNDLIDGGQGSESLSGGAGDDTIFGGNSGSSLFGGAGNDLLIGGNAKDFLVGEAGDDILTGANGSDTLDGGDGDDRLEGGRGDDAMSGGPGNDLVVESGDVDFVLTNSSLTGQGSDVLSGIEQASLTGGPGANTINASLFSGRASLDGGGGSDLLIGGAGGTTFLRPPGQTGNPTMIGGTGDDDYVLSPRGAISLIDSGGNDAIDFSQSPVAITLDLSNSDGVPQVVDAQGDTVSLNGQFESLDGTPFADKLTGGTAGGLLFGGTGSDSIVGGSGNSTLVSGGGNDLIFGGTGSDSIMGGSGNSTLVSGGGNDVIFGGTGSDSITGGSGDSTLVSGGGNDVIFGGTGSDSIVGGSGNSTLVSGGGNDVVFGGTGSDSIQGGSGNSTLMGGGGNDVIFGGTGGESIDGGVGDDLISGGSSNDVVSGGLGDDVIYGGSGDDQVDGGDGHDILFGGTGAPADLDGHDLLSGGPGDDLLGGEGGDDTLGGGAGNDTYLFSQGGLGSDVVDEPPDADSDTLDFSTFTGPVSIDLANPDAQVVNPGNLVLTLTSATGVENVVGGAFADTVLGNSRPNRLDGSDALPQPAGAAPGWDGRTQVVFLDFDSETEAGEHIYTAEERDAIEARIATSYILFHYSITQVQPTSGAFATLFFNKTPIINGQPQPGGLASELDFRNLNLGGSAAIDVNGFLGGTNQPSATSANFVAFSATVAAHELGHLVGLEHGDAFGPIGFGVHNPPGPDGYLPAYPGPARAFETALHLSASPASVGSTLFDAVGNPFFGEREAVKLAFAESGTTVPEQVAAHRALATAQPLTLAPLSVPNTLVKGLNAFKDFAVSAIDVISSIIIDPSTGRGESDFYSFTGQAGELMFLQVLSNTLTRIANPIDSLLRLYDAAGNLVSTFGAPAANDDGFETPDSVLIDVRLPSDGTYFIEVDTFNPVDGPDLDTGDYELLVYSFDAGNQTDLGDVLQGRDGGDTLDGGLGNDALDGGAGDDLMDGGLGDDVYIIVPGSADVVQDAGGADALDFSGAVQGISIDIGLGAGQVQTVDAGGNTLALSGTIDHVIGSAFADRIVGNAAGNILSGGSGDDTIGGGAGVDAIDGGTGLDTLSEARDADMTLVDASLQVGTEGADALISIEQASLTGGGGDNTLTLTGWSGPATLDGGGGADRLIVDGDLHFTLTDTALTRSSGGVLVLSSIERASWTGGVGANLIDASSFSGRVTLSGAGGNDTLTGGSGPDILIGGDGDDLLAGGHGRDILIGGNGADQLFGHEGDDLLIGGSTLFDQNLAALDAILAEWTSPNSYDDRIAHLTGATPGGLNGLFFLIKGVTVLDDAGARDSLSGGGGLDWFFSFMGDRVNDRERGESIL